MKNQVMDRWDGAMILRNAILHLEKHWPDRVGMYAQKQFYSPDSYPDYAACHILSALRDLIIYSNG